MAQTTQNEFETVPFPEGLPIIDLPRVSLKGLLENDEDESRKVFEISIKTGFFYLDLTDHPIGQKLLQEGNEVCRIGQEVLPNLSMEEKLAYKARDRSGVFDMGYKCPSVGKNGQPKFSEAFNIPFYELLVDKESGFQLPQWLANYKELFGSIMETGNSICHILLGILETKLQVEPGSLSSLHKIIEPSNDFLRVLRYPAPEPGDDPRQFNFPPHRDSVSIAMLFTWVAGLQILEPGYDINTAMKGDESGWRWVKPVAGHVIVNLGDALAILTNEHLKSGFHRVVSPPKEQAHLDKYSVLLGYRPALTTLMRPLPSPVIPPLTAEEAKLPILTCEEWGAQRVQKVYQVLENR
ncbi:oxidoreductase [Daldinia decipiens]|uniref:oxidoreductase n=1 Tax=Daldinia decipiens TaxID=326647 RepID=UPI0020C3CFBC|nr:oxidoreductase [Daldinia decipiens]KAI1661762.1 oxidoreductase [Daldinia decipiens]